MCIDIYIYISKETDSFLYYCIISTYLNARRSRKQFDDVV